MKEELLQKIKQLPPLPESAVQIEAVYHDPESGFKDMVKILEKDPLLTADILKAANSPLYGFSREINAISQAVSLFGMGTIRGFALASIVKKSFALDLSPYGISNYQFSELSKKQHALMRIWYLRKEPKLLDILSPAAFLVEIGKALIAEHIINHNLSDAFKEKINELGDVEAAERALCDMSTPEVSAAVFEHWHFESALVDTIGHASDPKHAEESNRIKAEILHVVRTAIPINGILSEESTEAAKALLETYELDAKSFEAALNKLQEKREE